MLNLKIFPQARQFIAFKQSICRVGNSSPSICRATAKHVGAEVMKYHLLNLFFHEEIKV